ncbi:MAG: pyrroline-5-carboxylate reductase [Proteobacteria bacterium]|nr:pyrroline-5-carboxylate reductase [Pseudomonadota bacterium]
MAQALAGGLLASGTDATSLGGADPSRDARVAFAEATGAKTVAENHDLVADSDVVVLAVKPGVAVGVLEDLAGATDCRKPLWISIAAGVSLGALQRALPAGTRIVRAMPNTPALVQAGATAYCGNSLAQEEDLATAEALFRAVGYAWRAPHESLLDAVTGLSGSGPAYVFLLLEALGDAGVRMGLPREAAARLAAETVHGAAKLALESGRHPAALKDQVTSPGGTTIAGLEQLERGGVRAALYEAVAAATRRSRELGD